jgi:hypothetical protein
MCSSAGGGCQGADLREPDIAEAPGIHRRLCDHPESHRRTSQTARPPNPEPNASARQPLAFREQLIFALHCIALHCIALHCIALHCIALHCIALHCIALPLSGVSQSVQAWMAWRRFFRHSLPPTTSISHYSATPASSTLRWRSSKSRSVCELDRHANSIVLGLAVHLDVRLALNLPAHPLCVRWALQVHAMQALGCTRSLHMP